jgi:predicted CXXCH cytochrome family protein
MEIRQLSPAFILMTLLVVVLLTLIAAGTALADNGPHGGYTPTTDACAGCHRAHTAGAARLLLDATPELCYTCHGSAGNGADTNVVDGVYLERDIESESPAEGVADRGLRGGGFQTALMDTDALTTTTAIFAPTTSSHTADGGLGTLWGNGPLTTTVYPGLAGYGLSCVSCHDPHGGGTYRILRPIPTASGASAPITVSDELTKTYTVADAGNDYMRENYGTRGSSLASWCSQCHTRYLAGSGSGHTDSGDAVFMYRHTTNSVSCVRCHVAHGTPATMNGFAADVEWPDAATTPSGNARSSLLRLNNRGVCAYCHLKDDGTISGGACDACHGAPPLSGAHAQHAGTDAVGYDLTGSFATDSDYQYGCGECHSTDVNQHQDGDVDVDLSPAGAPGGSLKARNAASATFAGGTCSGVYCHSGVQVASGPVGPPLDDGVNYILDEHGNLTYDSYTITETVIFQTTPPWDSGQINTCTACHEFPTLTSVPTVEAGVGDSHQWIGDYGYGNLHAWNMSYDPLPCRTCHYGEISEANTWTRDGMDVTTYDPVPLASRVLHANGTRNVTFDTTNPVIYDSTFSLAPAAYLPAEKACTNVACHLQQNWVEWGTPYRHWTNECDLCHRYAIPAPPPLAMTTLEATPAGSGVHPTPGVEGQLCTSCHTEAHGGR